MPRADQTRATKRHPPKKQRAKKAPQNPVGQKRHLDVAGQKLPRDNFCLSVVSQLPSPGGVISKEAKIPLLWARGNLGGILGDSLGRGNCESKINPRQRGDKFCRETSRCLAWPSGRGEKAPHFQFYYKNGPFY